MAARKTPKDEDGHQAWLRYRRINSSSLRQDYRQVSSPVCIQVPGPVGQSIQAEVIRGFKGLLGLNPEFTDSPARARFLVSLASQEARQLAAAAHRAGPVTPRPWPPAGSTHEGFTLACESDALSVLADSPAAALHGVFRLLALMAQKTPVDRLCRSETPANGLRMINHWDNMDGSVERGYAGASIFFRDCRFLQTKADLARITDYARLLASVGINAISINNVNVHQEESWLITPRHLPKVARLAEIFRSWGIRLFLSVNFAAPITVGGLGVSDPLDPAVISFWERQSAAVYQAIPDFGGYLVKADSEGRPGPFTYGRTQADGANMLARALGPHGGICIWRCFVYNCRQDWRDRSIDRAKAAYDHFLPLDGRFLDNVILQIKNGPMDFQVREPVSPLLGAMKKTNQVLELQITQEYTGQQRHVCWLAPQWKHYLGFDTHQAPGATLAQVASGQTHSRPLGGMAAVGNIGADRNWCGHHLAQANLHSFGRLAWDPALECADLAREWGIQTFGYDTMVQKTLDYILTESWPAYEAYTSPLGIGWMVNPHHHYGPNVDGYEYDRWGTYHFADCHGLGVDRSVDTGTAYAGQYHPTVAGHYESLETCPDDLVLFFHHLPYKHRLHSGKTVIQHIYDSHFDGVRKVQTFLARWQALEGRIDSRRYAEVLARLDEQLEQAGLWRDVVNTYFLRKSGIPDRKAAPDRIIYP